MKSEKALKRFIFWVGTAIVTNICIYIFMGKKLAFSFLTGYIIELIFNVR